MPPHDATQPREPGAQLRLQGRLAEAVDECRKALEQVPDDAGAWNELAHALRLQGKLAEAMEAAERAVRLNSDLAAAWFNLGAVRAAQGAVAQGMEAYRKALELKPDFAEAWSNLGGVLATQGKVAEEIDAYRRALAAKPQLAPVWSNLGNALREAGQFEEAVSACRRAVELDPGFAAAWNNLGTALHDSGKYEESARACEQALQLDPRYAEAWSNLGNAWQAMGRFDDALRAHQNAVEIQPANAELYFNLGVTHKYSGRIADAIACYRRGLASKPDSAEAHWNLGLALLATGELREGWSQYEWRWRRLKADARRYDFPAWDGDISKPCRLLLWAEQGIGDEIIYGSMVGDVVASPMSITLEVDPRLVSLFQRSLPRVKVVPRRDPPVIDPADYDCQAPLAGLGRWLRNSFESFPRQAGYLKADASRVETYRSRLRGNSPVAAMTVGISWNSMNREFGPFKSTALSDWAAILGVPHVRFVDLQYGDTAQERSAFEAQTGVNIERLQDLDLFNDIEGLAALCAVCDLVITASNVTAHVAGALGRPVWLLAPQTKGKIWYWFNGRRESPWYPSMRVFTQQTRGVWPETLVTIAQELAALSSDRKQ